MRIFSVSFSQVQTTEDILNWITSEETGGGKNCERYWIVRTDIGINNDNSHQGLFNLSAFLNMAHKNNYQSVQIIKNV